MTMTDRERFIATMHYQPVDRGMICDFGFWPETITEWKKQGLPDHIPERADSPELTDLFGMDRYDMDDAGLNVLLHPQFEMKVLEDRGDHELIQDQEGVIKLRHKYMSSIPSHVGHRLQDRASWEKDFKPRLDPDTPTRYPDWDAMRKIWQDDHYPYPRKVHAGSLYGKLRDWMGVENISYLIYDDPALFEEMVETIADLIIEVHRRGFEQGMQVDGASMWEDMCYNSGPLLGVEHFKKYLMPQYKRITDQLHDHGCDVVWLDCDGNIEHLMPLWLEVGVNCMFPVEIGTWGADPIRYRKEYGKDLLMMGGFDKHLLAQDKRLIVKEINRLAPLVEEGGYIPFCDHRVPPDVPLEHYLFYLEKAREIWGKGVNLHPMSPLDAVPAEQVTTFK